MRGHILILASEYPPVLWGGVGRYVMEVEAALTEAGDPPIVRCIPSYTLPDRDRGEPRQEAVFLTDPAFASHFGNATFDLSRYRCDCARLASTIWSTISTPVRAIFLQDFYLVGVAEALSHRLPDSQRAYFAHLPLSARFTYFEKSASDEMQQALEAAAILWADKVLVPSRFARRNVCSIYPISPDRVHVAPLAVGRFETPDVPRDPHLITCVGRFTEQKGWDAVIDVVRQLEDKAVHGRYVIVGKGAYRSVVETELGKLLPAERFEIHDQLDSKQALPGLLSRSSVFLQLSAYETFGLAALEAASLGAVPVLAAVGAIPEVFASESGAILVTPGDTASAASAIEDLFADPDKAAARSLRLREYASRFRWSAHADQLRQLLSHG